MEHLKFEDVDYWNEICDIMEWTKSHVFSTLHICWAALAGLYYHFDIPKYDLAQKMFGVFPQHVLEPHCQLLRGFNDVFHAPHSRHAEVHREDIEKVEQLKILTESPLSGVHIVANKNGRQYFITGHSEYDRDTLKGEYFRDKEKGADIALPYDYFPDDDPTKEPHYSWGCSANLLFSNWLNYCVYQQTPYDLTSWNCTTGTGRQVSDDRIEERLLMHKRFHRNRKPRPHRRAFGADGVSLCYLISAHIAEVGFLF